MEKTGLRITESAATGLCNSLLLAKLLELLLILSPLENLEKVKLNQDKKNGSKSWPGSPPHGSPPLGSSSPLLVNTCPERAVYPEKGERRKEKSGTIPKHRLGASFRGQRFQCVFTCL